jgi:hypothetical protein
MKRYTRCGGVSRKSLQKNEVIRIGVHSLSYGRGCRTDGLQPAIFMCILREQLQIIWKLLTSVSVTISIENEYTCTLTSIHNDDDYEKKA